MEDICITIDPCPSVGLDGLKAEVASLRDLVKGEVKPVEIKEVPQHVKTELEAVKRERDIAQAGLQKWQEWGLRYSAENEGIKAEMASLLPADCSEQVNRIADLERLLQAEQSARESYSAELEQARNKILELEQEIALKTNVASDLAALQALHTTCEQQRIAAEERVAELESENAALLRRIQESRKDTPAPVDLNEKIAAAVAIKTAALNRMNSELENTIRDLRLEIAEQKSKDENPYLKREPVDPTNALQADHTRDLADQKNLYATEIAKLKEEHAARLKEVEDEADKQISALTSLYYEKSKNMAAVHEERAKATKERTQELEREIARLVKAEDEAPQEDKPAFNVRLREIMAEIDGEDPIEPVKCDGEKKCKTALQEKEEEIVRLTDKLDASKQVIEDLKRQLDFTKTIKKEEHEDSEGVNASNDATVASNEEEIKALTAKIAELADHEAQLQAEYIKNKSIIANLQTEKESLSNDLKKYRRKEVIHDSVVEALNITIGALEAQLASHTAVATNEVTRLANLGVKVENDAISTVNILKTEHDKLVTNCAAVKAQYDSLLATEAVIKQEIADKDREIATLKLTLETTKAIKKEEHEDNEGVNASNDATIEEYEKEIDALKADILVLQNQVAQLQEEWKKNQATISTLQTEKASLSSDLEECRKKAILHDGEIATRDQNIKLQNEHIALQSGQLISADATIKEKTKLASQANASKDKAELKAAALQLNYDKLLADCAALNGKHEALLASQQARDTETSRLRTLKRSVFVTEPESPKKRRVIPDSIPQAPAASTVPVEEDAAAMDDLPKKEEPISAPMDEIPKKEESAPMDESAPVKEEPAPETVKEPAPMDDASTPTESVPVDEYPSVQGVREDIRGTGGFSFKTENTSRGSSRSVFGQAAGEKFSSPPPQTPLRSAFERSSPPPVQQPPPENKPRPSKYRQDPVCFDNIVGQTPFEKFCFQPGGDAESQLVCFWKGVNLGSHKFHQLWFKMRDEYKKRVGVSISSFNDDARDSFLNLEYVIGVTPYVKFAKRWNLLDVIGTCASHVSLYTGIELFALSSTIFESIFREEALKDVLAAYLEGIASTNATGEKKSSLIGQKWNVQQEKIRQSKNPAQFARNQTGPRLRQTVPQSSTGTSGSAFGSGFNQKKPSSAFNQSNFSFGTGSAFKSTAKPQEKGPETKIDPDMKKRMPKSPFDVKPEPSQPTSSSYFFNRAPTQPVKEEVNYNEELQRRQMEEKRKNEETARLLKEDFERRKEERRRQEEENRLHEEEVRKNAELLEKLRKAEQEIKVEQSTGIFGGLFSTVASVFGAGATPTETPPPPVASLRPDPDASQPARNQYSTWLSGDNFPGGQGNKDLLEEVKESAPSYTAGKSAKSLGRWLKKIKELSPDEQNIAREFIITRDKVPPRTRKSRR